MFFLALAAFFLAGGLRFVIRGQIRGVGLEPDISPYGFWGLVVLSFAMAAFSIWWGVVDLLGLLRERKIQSGLR